MRRVSLFFFVAINLCGSGIAHAASSGTFRIFDWTGSAYWNKQEKQLDHCSAQLTNADKITLIYSLDRQYVWSLAISSPDWNFVKGASFQVAFKLGDRGYLRVPVVAEDKQLVQATLLDSLTFFDSLKGVIQLGFAAGGLTSQFNMAYAPQILTALTKCVERYGASSRSHSAIVAWLKSMANSRSDKDASLQNEASTLASNIMIETRIPKASKALPNEIPAGLTGDAFWKAGKTFFSVSILTNNQTNAVDSLPSLIIGGEAQRCRGDLFAGAKIDVIGKYRAARAITNCITLDATTTAYYLAIPRTKGGIYLLTTMTNGFEIPALGGQTAEDVDSRVRASIAVALAKSGNAKQ